MRQWFAGARPRTLPAAVVPVIIGAASIPDGTSLDGTVVTNVLLALVVSLALQVAVNYANDYSDGVKGTDAQRAGPTRLVGGRLAEPSAVRRAAFVSFAVAAIVGVLLAVRTSLWLVPIGIACVVAGWTYTGGPRPYGYAGLGELFVFIFFGLVATVGTTFVASGDITVLSILSGCVAGFLACALLLVNNIRDIDGDRASGKRTLAVRLGSNVARWMYVSCYVAAAVIIVAAASREILALIGLVGLLAALPAIATVRTAQRTDQLVAALAMTARVQLIVGLLYALGLVIQ